MTNLDAAVPHLFALAIGLLVALPLWFAGSARRLTLDYRRMADPAALNRWAAWRLTLLPLVAAVHAGLALLGWHAGVLYLATVMAIAAWLVIGSRRFRKPDPRAP